jgi:hypothetical protein
MTLFVSQDGSGEDGLSWETSFARISDALNASRDGDEIRCAIGTYSENFEISTSVQLVGGFDPDIGKMSSKQKPSGQSIIRASQANIVVQFLADSTLKNFIVEGGFGVGSGVVVGRGDARNLNVTLDNCIFRDNESERGAGVMVNKSNLLITHCIIEDNRANTLGAGIAIKDGTVVLDRCLIRNNRMPQWLPGYEGEFETQGGGLHSHDSTVHIRNSLFYGNYAGLYSEFTVSFDDNSMNTGTLINSTIIGDSRYMLYLATYSDEPTIKNSIIRGPGNVLIGDFFRVANSNISGGYPGPGNIDADPLFIDPENGDFRLQPGSPCIDSGTTVDLTTDFDGNPRPIDIPEVGRDGTGDEFDMGAFEYVPPTPTPEPTFVNPRSDIDQSGEVDSLDLLIFLADWKKMTMGGEKQ